MNVMREYIEELQKVVREAGIQKGDMVYVASDATLLLSEARKRAGVKTAQQRDEFLHSFVDMLQECVGIEGTLLFPVFTWTFCRGKEFDVRLTKGEVGALPNWILAKRQDFVRTQHPIYSFMVWGNKQALLAGLANKGSFDSDSPFAYLHHNKGKMLFVNVSLQRGFTFMHYVEQCVKVPYRYHKEFESEYIYSSGNAAKRIYSMYVRDLDIESHEYMPDEFLDARGITKTSHCHALTLKAFELSKAYDIVADDFLHHQGEHCYKFVNYAIDWTKGQTHDDHKIGD